jgi:putative oxidoreductase
MKYSLTFVRIALGLIVFVHGLAACFGLFGGGGIDQMAADMAVQLSVAPQLLAYLVSYATLVCGLLLLLGPAAKVSALIMLALVVIHILASARYRAFFVRDNGIEFLLAVAALCSVVVTHGPGPWVVKIPAKTPKK